MTEPIRRLATSDVAGGGANNPFNYELVCVECGATLAILGTLVQRKFTAQDVAALSALGHAVDEGASHQTCHCGRCHAQTWVVEGREVIVQPTRAMGATCGVCGREWLDPRKLSETQAKAVS